MFQGLEIRNLKVSRVQVGVLVVYVTRDVNQPTIQFELRITSGFFVVAVSLSATAAQAAVSLCSTVLRSPLNDSNPHAAVTACLRLWLRAHCDIIKTCY